MKIWTTVSLLPMAMSVLLAPGAQATGFIVIDNTTQPVAMLPGSLPMAPPSFTQPPTQRPSKRPAGNWTAMPPSRSPLLQGNISFGLHLQAEEIKVDVSDQVAKTYITQIFVNDTDRNLAGTYLFPLPDDTTFSSFSLHIDGRPVEGKILEAKEARQQYEEIVRKMVDPGLLEYADYKTVRARIFPIPAHGTKKVELEYTQLLRADNGMLKYRFPLKAQGDALPVEQIKVNLELKSKQGLRTIWSPSHEITSNKLTDNKATVAYASHNSVPDRDFLLYYSVSNKDLAANTLSHKVPGEDGYFLLTLTPPVSAQKVVGKDLILVADTSGSMQGEKIEQTKKALKYIVNALNPEDRFGILQFNTDVDAFRSSLSAANSESKKQADAFIGELEARGGTNIGGALHMAASMLNEASARPAYIVLMTDGEPTVGETDVNKLVAGVQTKRDLRVFDFGVGYDVNTRLLNKLAENHHGTSQYIEPGENLETALASFYQKIKSPVLSNVQLTFDGIDVKDVYPREVKDIFAGTQVLLLGKYKEGAKGSVHLSGVVNGASKAYSFPLSFSADEPGHTYLPRLWAMRRIGHLTEIAQDNHENREVIDEIVALSKKYGIISAYTSFLVTDPSENHRLPNISNIQGVPVALGGRGGMVSSSLPPMPMVRFYRAQADEREVRASVNSPVQQSLGRQISADSLSSAAVYETGRDAVVQAKSVNKLKSSAVLSDARVPGNLTSIKTVEDKTFYLLNGTWTDSAYSAKDWRRLDEICFGSKEYFRLVHDLPGIAKYLAVGKQLIVIFNGHCYKITGAVT